ncbi:MAG: TetR/AcrR family transcriptional regulator [Rhodoglobus sp.]|uniref:TetR/AcrR family transcriptional regulator n=1 Tax=Salinibacterium sp. M195 TaxID=2583374 RepID=UPI001C62B4D3|nr:TetR/AcrR family transcriptional regulator [Salinibacterium sp. M195]QYH35127.1 TetR family transcriptional regulator [Salinibacterium sp. M195]
MESQKKLVVGLRERNRRTAMRDTQREALRLFYERGFTHVSVDEIATNLGMAASTVFRHFGTKEALVLWDEHDSALEEALTKKLTETVKGESPFYILRDVFIDTLASRYREDLEFELQRVRLIYQTEALHAAAIEAQFTDREELTAALKQLLTPRHENAASLLAGAALLALDAAVERWQAANGKDDLGTLVHEAFTTLETLASVR